MSLSWPWALIALLIVPLLLAARWWLNRRRRRSAVPVSSVALIQAALPGRTAWRRRIPVWLFLAGLLVLAGGLSRPQVSISVPSNNTSILLALDVSGSMCSTDVPPNRLAVASEAARNFIKKQNDGTRIGLVAFSGIAGLLVPPTTDKDKLLDAIDGLKTARGTAIGQGILASIDAIAEMNPNVAATGVDLGDAAPNPMAGYEPDTIVVLTDGSNTTGVDPVTAAEQAAARRVRIYTIGFGTTEPAQMMCTANQIGGDGAFGGGGFPRGGGGFGAGRRAQPGDRRGRAAEGRGHHRRALLPGRGRRPAHRRARRPAQGDRPTQGERRDHRVVRARGRAAGLHRGRSEPLVEPGAGGAYCQAANNFVNA